MDVDDIVDIENGSNENEVQAPIMEDGNARSDGLSCCIFFKLCCWFYNVLVINNFELHDVNFIDLLSYN